MKESRAFGISIRQSLNNVVTYQKLYQPGNFPGVADSVNRTHAVIMAMTAKLYLPTAVSGSLSGRSMRLIQKTGSTEVELFSVNFIAISSEYFVNLLTSFSGVPSWSFSQDTELGIYLGVALTANEKIDLFGFAFEDISL